MRAPIPTHYKQTILRRQDHKCKVCSMFLDVYDIDHIVPYRVHGVHKLKNLQALCPTCHARKTRKEATELALYIRCEQTKSHRYCWSCKKIVSSYFGFIHGTCAACSVEELTHLNQTSLILNGEMPEWLTGQA